MILIKIILDNYNYKLENAKSYIIKIKMIDPQNDSEIAGVLEIPLEELKSLGTNQTEN